MTTAVALSLFYNPADFEDSGSWERKVVSNFKCFSMWACREKKPPLQCVNNDILYNTQRNISQVEKVKCVWWSSSYGEYHAMVGCYFS